MSLYELVHDDLDNPLSPTVDYLLLLGEDELLVLSNLAERLERGRETYGRLDIKGDRRDWAVESWEEAADLSIYLVMAILRLQRTPAPRPALSVVRDDWGYDE